jgi:hypothetical protein
VIAAREAVADQVTGDIYFFVIDDALNTSAFDREPARVRAAGRIMLCMPVSFADAQRAALTP